MNSGLYSLRTISHSEHGVSDIRRGYDQNLVTTTYYDPLGRVRLIVDADGNKVAKAYRPYNPTGGAYEEDELQSNPYSSTSDSTTVGWTVTRRDPAGRVKEVDRYTGSAPPAPWGGNGSVTGTSTAVYDQNGTSCAGPVTTLTDEAGNVHIDCSDGLGRLVSVTEPDPVTGSAGTVTTYTYDMLNNMSAVDVTGQLNNNCTLPGYSATHMRCFAYSTLSRLVSASNPESGTTAYLYDLNGNMTQRTDADGNVTNVNGYDGLNRSASTSYTVAGMTQATPTVTYVYDQDFKGALSSVANSVSTTSYAHDAFGRVVGSAQTMGTRAYTLAYGYSLTDALTSMQYPSGRQVNYALDAADRVATVQNVTRGGNYATLAYKASGAVAATTMGNGVTQTYTWNDRVQPTGLTVAGASGSLLTLGFYPCAGVATTCAANNGNLQSQTIAAPGLSLTQTYSYDHLNRLTEAQETGGSGWDQQYGFDALGNRWAGSSTGSPSLPLTLETSQSSSWYSTTAPNRIANWSYDPAGNVLNEGFFARSFTYDAENRQVTANVGGPGSSYSYDGNGLRLSRATGGQTIIYVYEAWGNVAAEYSNVVETTACGTPTCYLTQDHLGSTRMVTDSAGNVPPSSQCASCSTPTFLSRPAGSRAVSRRRWPTWRFPVRSPSAFRRKSWRSIATCCRARNWPR